MRSNPIQRNVKKLKKSHQESIVCVCGIYPPKYKDWSENSAPPPGARTLPPQCCAETGTESQSRSAGLTLCDPMGCAVYGILQARSWRGSRPASPAGTEAALRARCRLGQPSLRAAQLAPHRPTAFPCPTPQHRTGVTAPPLQTVLRTRTRNLHS